MLPCGIPLNTLNQDDCSPFSTTHCFLLHRKSLIHTSKSSFILYVFNLNSSLWWGTVSKAFAKSVYMTSICPPESNCNWLAASGGFSSLLDLSLPVCRWVYLLIYLFPVAYLQHVSAVDWRSLFCLPPMKGIGNLVFVIILYSLHVMLAVRFFILLNIRTDFVWCMYSWYICK